jgi:predicted transcriptional regulator
MFVVHTTNDKNSNRRDMVALSSQISPAMIANDRVARDESPAMRTLTPDALDLVSMNVEKV